MSDYKPHVVIDEQKNIILPEELKNHMVQYDHNVKTITFDCPRYSDGRDLSTMRIYVNYFRTSGEKGTDICENIKVDSKDNNLIHFEWIPKRSATLEGGVLVFLVCAEKEDAEGNQENAWHTKLCKDLKIAEGIDCLNAVIEKYPTVITYLLTRMEDVESIATPEAMQAYVNQYLLDYKENYVKDNSVDCISGLNGFYYKVIDRGNKIIYLTKEQCNSPKIYLTYEEYNSMTADEQKAYYNSFENVADFFAWYNWAKSCHEQKNPPIEIGGDCVINLEEILNQKESEEKITYFGECSLAKVEEDLYYSGNAVGKLLSVSNGSEYKNVLTITKVEAGKIFYELAGNEDPFKTIEQVDNLSHEDFAVWCYNWHDEGAVGIAFGSHAEGCHTIARSSYQHVQGKYNIEDKDNKYAHIVGNGTSDDERSNAHTLDWEGNAWYAGTIETTANILKSSTEGSNKRFKITVDDSGALSVTEIV